MDKKGKRGSHPDRSKKRRFQGNQSTVEHDINFASTSAEKLANKKTVDDIKISRVFDYCILNFFSVFSTISSNVICKICKKEVKFYQTTNRGLGFKIAIQCECDEKLIESCPFINNAYEINRRIVLVMRLLGIGREGINLFCALMDICQGLAINTNYSCIENVHIAASSVYDCLIQNAVQEEKKKNAEAGNAENNLIISGDGTWKKRGFSSLFVESQRL